MSSIQYAYHVIELLMRILKDTFNISIQRVAQAVSECVHVDAEPHQNLLYNPPPVGRTPSLMNICFRKSRQLQHHRGVSNEDQIKKGGEVVEQPSRFHE